MNRKQARSTSKLTPLFICLFASLCAALPAHAQDDAPWYQVEVIIFENRAHNSYGPDAEAWPRDILIAYPMHSRYLLTPEELKQLEAMEQASNENMVRNETAFIDLGESVAQLNRAMQAINRERNMRVLFHKVWRQPVGNQENTPAVIVQGGNRYDEHHELEGSLRVTVSRYLHLHADLWFTSFEANIGQEDTWWPRLPVPPKRNLDPNSVEEFIQPDTNKLRSTTPPWQTAGNENSNMRFGLNSSVEDTSNQQDTLKNYVTKEIATLSQSRRMRSGELHYIDHPKLGIIVRIDNYKTQAGQTGQ